MRAVTALVKTGDSAVIIGTALVALTTDSAKQMSVGQLDIKELAIILGVIWAIFRIIFTPFMDDFVFKIFFRSKENTNRFTDSILRALQSDEAKPRVRRFVDELYVDRLQLQQKFQDKVDANEDRLEKLDASTLALGTTLNKELTQAVKLSTEAVQTMNGTVQEIKRTTEAALADMRKSHEDGMDELHKLMLQMVKDYAELKGRIEAWDGVERRHKNGGHGPRSA